jgi:hypothetical protein
LKPPAVVQRGGFGNSPRIVLTVLTRDLAGPDGQR